MLETTLKALLLLGTLKEYWERPKQTLSWNLSIAVFLLYLMINTEALNHFPSETMTISKFPHHLEYNATGTATSAVGSFGSISSTVIEQSPPSQVTVTATFTGVIEGLGHVSSSS